MALSALTRPYHVRRDCLMPDRSTADNIRRSTLWALKAHLMDQIATGTTGPNARNPASVWTCVGSSNGTTGALDGVDRWGSTFNAANLVWAPNGTNHSWICLQNSTLGVQIVIDLQSSPSNVLFALTTTALPFSGGTGGTVSNRPFRSASEVNFGYSTVADNNWINSWYPEVTTGLNHRTHFLCAADGSFFFFTSRDGSGFMPTCIGVTNPQDSAFFPKRAGDTNAQSFFGSAIGSAVGAALAAFDFGNWQSNTAHTRRMPNTALMATGGMFLARFGGSSFNNAGTAIDPFSAEFSSVPIAFHALTPQGFPYGVLPDFYVHGNRSLIPNGTVHDPSGVITHVSLGDIWVPWNGSAPTL